MKKLFLVFLLFTASLVTCSDNPLISAARRALWDKGLVPLDPCRSDPNTFGQNEASIVNGAYIEMGKIHLHDPDTKNTKLVDGITVFSNHRPVKTFGYSEVEAAIRELYNKK